MFPHTKMMEAFTFQQVGMQTFKSQLLKLIIGQSFGKLTNPNHTMKTEYTIIISGKKSGHIMLDDGEVLKLKDLGFKPRGKHQPKVLFLNK